MKLGSDPDWKRLQEGIVCSCGETHKGLVDLMIYWPDGWKRGRESIEPNQKLRLTGDFLSDDFCVLDGKFFAIRTTLSLPIRGGEAKDKMNIVCWSALLKDAFIEYANAAPRGKVPGTGRAPSHLVNNILGYPKTFAMDVDLDAPGGMLRPKVLAVVQDHPLFAEQRDGITFERCLELFAANGHEMRKGQKSKSGLFGQKK